MAGLKLISFLFVIFGSVISHGQSISVQLERYMNDVRNYKSVAHVDAFLVEENAEPVLVAVQIYYQDSVSKVRSKAYEIVARLGLQSKKLDVRKMAVNKLISAYTDSDAGNIDQLWSLLSKFKREDFTVMAKDSLKSSFRKKPPHLDKLMRLMGYLEMGDMKEEIRPLTLPPTNTRDRWSALLSLARMGDESAIQSVWQRTQKLKMNDDVVYEVFPDLVYTRQPTVINLMITVLNSDEKNCFSADAEHETPIPCAYRVMEQLAPAIEHYPLLLDASGDVVTKDYLKSLEDVRKWFRKKGPNYKIIKDSF